METQTEKEKRLIELHKQDALNTIENLKTAKDTSSGGDSKWEDVVKTRTEHCEAFIKSLEVQEKQYEHFK